MLAVRAFLTVVAHARTPPQTPNAVAPLFNESTLYDELQDVFLKAHAMTARGRLNLIFARMPSQSSDGVVISNFPVYDVRWPFKNNTKKAFLCF